MSFASLSPRRAALWAPGLAFFLSLSACSGSEPQEPVATTPATSTTVDKVQIAESEPQAQAELDQDAASDDKVDEAISSAEHGHEAAKNPNATPGADEFAKAAEGGIPLEINADVERWIEYFTVKDRDRFQRFMERGEKYRAQVTAVLKDQGIPPEIYYQALIESGFACGATSKASAAGIWQFMKNTGRRYGLRVDNYVDERRDPMRATIAAALYLKDLYNVFQSWYLAMAAYNAGEGRIMSAIMRSKTRDFWQMVERHDLPAETMNYIPKFLAATIIGHDPRKYGFDDLRPELIPPLVAVDVPSPVRLADVAKSVGLPLDSLKDYNQHLLRGVTPPGVATYRIWVPKDQASLFEGKTEQLTALRLTRLKAVAVVTDAKDSSAAVPRYHTVVAGDTLRKVASLYGISVRQLRRLNHLRGGRLVPGSRLILAKPTTATASEHVAHRYKVKRGDRLETIARHFGVTVDELVRTNGLKHRRVFAGQLLTITQKG